LSTATDVYSLGVVLYEVARGQTAYRVKMPSAAQLEEPFMRYARLDAKSCRANLSDQAGERSPAT